MISTTESVLQIPKPSDWSAFNTGVEVRGPVYLDWCVTQDLFEALLADWVPLYDVLQENVQNLCLLACSIGQQVITGA